MAEASTSSPLRAYDRLPAVEVIRDLIRAWWGVELALADERGYVLEHLEGRIIPPRNELCRLALFSKEGFRRCNESVREVSSLLRRGEQLEGQRRTIVHSCHLGFDLVACPIVLGGEPAGFVFVGGSLQRALRADEGAARIAQLRDCLQGLELSRLVDELQAIPIVAGRELDQLRDLLERCADEISAAHAAAPPARIPSEPLAPPRFDQLVGGSGAMRQIFYLLDKIVASESTVLIQGESGTGKELIARAIHDNGPRRRGTFVVQNCSAFNDNLLESALFGHVRGSFTGAVKDKKGLFEIADRGTFFLDEIGDMSPALQVKLLRVLQEGTFIPVGGTEPREVDVRVIAATHKDLQRMVERGEFREDLYYRINVIRVEMPPLRDRMDDLPQLLDHFLRKHHRPRAPSASGALPRFSTAALSTLSRYRWPGNIRELENEVERCLVLGAGLDELPEELLSQRMRDAVQQAERDALLRAPPRQVPTGLLKDAVEQLEREVIHQGLIRTHWNKSQLAKELGISRSNLIAKVERFGLDRSG
jgi:transcriptional regulator with GAF, ATPase, and Fis domain